MTVTMAREKGRFKKESKQKQKQKNASLSLKKDDMQWLTANTHFDKGNIKEWHQVGKSDKRNH